MPNAIDLTTIQRVRAWLQSQALPVWTANFVIPNNNVPPYQINDSNGHLQVVTAVTGDNKTGSAAPMWNTNGGQTVDNHVTWQDMGISEDQMIQDCITAASLMFLWRTGRLPLNGDVPDTSPLVEPVTFDEWYSGNGSDQMFLRQTPIQQVTTLKINGNSIPQSTDYGVVGWMIDDDGKSLVLRPGGGGGQNFFTTTLWGAWGLGGYRFVKGMRNINVVYKAGFSSTPPDLELACRRIVSKNYKTRNWIGQRSQAMSGGAGTINFNGFDIEPEDDKILVAYTQIALA
jgi:hypothetical protein